MLSHESACSAYEPQPECLRVKAPTFWLCTPKKKRFCVWNFALYKVTMLSQQSACSVCAPRTAWMLACNSTYMFAGGHKVDSVSGTLRCTSKTHYLPTKALFQWIDHTEPEYSSEKATACRLKAAEVDSASGTLQKANKSQCSTTKELGQCVHHAQPENSHVKAPSCWLEATKSRFRVWNLCYAI